ncbi:hypothetical protein QQ73_21825, partial [Candidatus Endoriftia persephone str. Guaymas]|nr:hypothetical protein [Candidatus Endoriftia persephone str. Guaymas]
MDVVQDRILVDRVELGIVAHHLHEGFELTALLIDGGVRNVGGEGLAALDLVEIDHNVHTYELIRGDAKGPKKTISNISQPEPNTVTSTIKMKKGPAMKVECDAHDFMHGFVFVAKNPYFAKVKADG